MAKILGLDLGTNSIGWALIDDATNQIIKTGVRIFPEGVNRDTKGKEISKNETRRDARQKRRQTFRTNLRKKHLIKALQYVKMYPLPNDEKILQEYFHNNPYQLRSKALAEKLTLFELGRIFFHIAQRRGFKSSRKAGTSEESVIMKGDEKIGKIGIIDTNKAIEKGSYQTLGNYLNSIDTKEQRIRNRYTTRQMYIDEFEKIWEKQKKYYPTVLTNELKEKIGNIKTGILFFQRPLRSQKGLVGKCTFEKSKTRCPVSAIPFELYRTYQFINSIEIYSPEGEIYPLTPEQREEIVLLFNRKDVVTFFEIVKRLGFTKGYKYNYSADENKKKGDSRPGNKTIIQLSKLFGKEWDSLSENEKELRWHIIYFANDNEWLENYARNNWSVTDKQIEQLKKISFKQDYASLSRKAINNILPFLKKGYTYSTAVILGGIRNSFGEERYLRLAPDQSDVIEKTVLGILQNTKMKESVIDVIKDYLRKQFNLTDKDLQKLYHHSDLDAVIQKPLTETLPVPPNIRNPIVQQALFELQSLTNAISKEFGLPDEIKVELAREMKVPKSVREEIHWKQKERENENNEVKKVLDEYGLHHSRQNIQKYLLWKECKHQCPYTGTEISIKHLFEEGFVQIEHIFPWSVSLDDSMANKTICLVKENQAKGDRTPFQFYGNDPYKWNEVKTRAYKLLPFRKYQRFTKQEIDTDFVSRQLNDTRYISREAKTYLESICKKVNVSSGGVTSELRHYWGLDTILNPRINVGNSIPEDNYWAAINAVGTIAETISWTYEQREEPVGLHKKGRVVIGYVRKGYFYITGGAKNRTDHRHHAVDALTIANTKVSFIQELSRWNRTNKTSELKDFPLPWYNFHTHAVTSINNILIAYKAKNRITTKIKKRIRKKINGGMKEFISVGVSARGALHEETVYGRRKNSFRVDNEYFNVRKPLQSLTPAMIPKIVDTKIRELAYERLKKRGLKIDKENNKPIVKTIKEKEIFGKVFDKPLYLPNENGEPVPVKKIRIRVESSNMKKLKDNINQWVEPGSNYCVSIYEKEDGSRFGIMTSFLEAVERKNQKTNIVDKNISDGKFVMNLSKDELVLMDYNQEDINWSNPPSQIELSKKLYKVRKMTSSGNNISIIFTYHLASKVNADSDPSPTVLRKAPNTLKAIKVKITLTGKIEPVKE